MSNYPDESELLKKITLFCEKVDNSRSILKEYRKSIIFLKLNNYTQKQIVRYLNENNIKCSTASLSYYLKNYPITDNELIKGKIEYNNIHKNAIKERNEKLKRS
ncbi:MAG TPA: hypothetical protein QF753_19865 [Victivallales bacterium]|nr:hypothetical protein [Victivallales bacterium]